MCRRADYVLTVAGLVALVAGGFFSSTARAASWPQWQGPNRNGNTSEPSGTWPPPKKWEVTLGYSDSSPIITGGKVYVLGLDGSSTRVKCLNADTGAQIWTGTTPGGRRGRYYSSADSGQYYGPLSTPACDGTYLFTLSVDGDLQCWNASSGAKRWGKNLYDTYKMTQRPNVGGGMRDFGYTSSPMLSGSNVIVETGGSGGTVKAFRKTDGAQVGAWGSGYPGHTSGPTGPDGKIFLGLSSIYINGTTRSWETDYACNIPTPAWSGNYVVATSDYNISRTKCYQNGSEIWSVSAYSKVGSPVISGSYVYLPGHQLRCRNLSNGSSNWTGPGLGGGQSLTSSEPGTCLVAGDGRIIALGNGNAYLVNQSNGSVLSSVAAPTGYPAVALGEGKLLCKSRNKLACFQVGASGPTAPGVTTLAATNVTATSARLNGEVTSTGGENPTVRIYWGDNDGGTGSWDHVENLGTKGAGTFYKDVSGLASGTTYYFRCHATNSAGSTWASPSRSFTTPSKPGVTTLDASNVTASAARLNGQVTSTGGENPTVKIYWGDNDGGTGTWDHEENLGTKGTGTFYRDVSGLASGTTYYFRCYASNSAGGTWASASKSFTTIAKPGVTTLDTSNVTANSARLNGQVTSTGGENPSVVIYWGDNDGGTTASSWDDVESLGTKGVGAFYRDVTGLTAAKTYYFRCYASNSAGGTWASATKSFTTLATKPGVTTLDATNVTASAARLNGEVTSTGGENPTVTVYWGDNDGGTGSWDNAENLGAKGVGTFYKDVGSLASGTTYYFRCYASNSSGGTWASASKSFTTIAKPGVTTLDATGATVNSARLNGQVTSTGGENPTVTIYWGDNDGGTGTWDNAENLGAKGTGTFFKDVTGLAASTTYYFRCYASNSAGGTWASATKSFTTLSSVTPPSVTTVDATNVTENSAQLNGDLTSTGGENPTVTIYWGDNDGGTGTWDSAENLGTMGAGAFFKDVAGLASSTTYYFRCHAQNSAGATWASATKSFTTSAGITNPAVATNPASNVAATSARLNGEVTSTGGENPTVKIYWGTTDGGTTAASWTNVEDLGAKGTGTFYKDVTGLATGQTYYYRCHASNSAGETWASSSQSFTTTTTVGGLVGHWKFDEGSGTTAADSSPKGNHGTVNGATWVPGKIGGGLSLAGTDSSYVEIPNETDYDLKDAVSYAVWLKADPADYPNSWMGVVTKGDHMNIQSFGTENHFVWQTKDSPGTISQYQLHETVNCIDNTWHHLVATFDGAAKKKCIYVDGELNDSVEAIGYINTTDYPLLIGKNGAVAGHAFKGLVDDVRVYDYALTLAEVQALHQMASGPAITQQPQSVTVTEGDPATFTVTATGTGTLHYQWYEDGAQAGTDSATYVISSTSLSQDGHVIYCVVTDDNGSTQSDSATLTVGAAPVPPTITQQPQSVTVTEGDPVSFTIVATGTGTLHYQWYEDGAQVGIDSNAYAIASADLSQNGHVVYCVVTDDKGTVQSDPATLTVEPAQQGPSITQQPQDRIVTEGDPATFTVSATGTGTLHYQWYQAGAQVGTDNATYTIVATTLAQNNDEIYCVVTDDIGSVQSYSVTLTVNEIGKAPTINQHPQDQTVLEGGSASFTVAATGTGTLHYQWYEDGAKVGSDSSAYTIASADLARDGAVIYCVVTDDNGSAQSGSATLTVNQAGPQITQHPQDRTVVEGGSASFTVAATGTGALHYQWYEDGAQVGSDSATYGITSAALSQDGHVIYCEVTDDTGSTKSSSATLTVKAASADSDNDGMDDAWERDNFDGSLDHDGTADTDSDGLTDLEEYQNATDPNDNDTDDDALTDGWEVQYGFDPADGDEDGNGQPDGYDDTDADGHTNTAEMAAGSNPRDGNSVPKEEEESGAFSCVPGASRAGAGGAALAVLALALAALQALGCARRKVFG